MTLWNLHQSQHLIEDLSSQKPQKTLQKSLQIPCNLTYISTSNFPLFLLYKNSLDVVFVLCQNGIDMPIVLYAMTLNYESIITFHSLLTIFSIHFLSLNIRKSSFIFFFFFLSAFLWVFSFLSHCMCMRRECIHIKLIEHNKCVNSCWRNAIYMHKIVSHSSYACCLGHVLNILLLDVAVVHMCGLGWKTLYFCCLFLFLW